MSKVPTWFCPKKYIYIYTLEYFLWVLRYLEFGYFFYSSLLVTIDVYNVHELLLYFKICCHSAYVWYELKLPRAAWIRDDLYVRTFFVPLIKTFTKTQKKNSSSSLPNFCWISTELHSLPNICHNFIQKMKTLNKLKFNYDWVEKNLWYYILEGN